MPFDDHVGIIRDLAELPKKLALVDEAGIFIRLPKNAPHTSPITTPVSKSLNITATAGRRIDTFGAVFSLRHRGRKGGRVRDTGQTDFGLGK